MSHKKMVADLHKHFLGVSKTITKANSNLLEMERIKAYLDATNNAFALLNKHAKDLSARGPMVGLASQAHDKKIAAALEKITSKATTAMDKAEKVAAKVEAQAALLQTSAVNPAAKAKQLDELTVKLKNNIELNSKSLAAYKLLIKKTMIDGSVTPIVKSFAKTISSQIDTGIKKLNSHNNDLRETARVNIKHERSNKPHRSSMKPR